MTEQDKILIFKVNQIGAAFIESTPEQDFGLDWDIHSNCEYIRDINYRYHESGLVPIEKIIGVLQTLHDAGSNYVAVDWNEDHQEFDIVGVSFNLASEEQRKALFDEREQDAESRKAAQIKALEDQLKRLKS